MEPFKVGDEVIHNEKGKCSITAVKGETYSLLTEDFKHAFDAKASEFKANLPRRSAPKSAPETTPKV